MTNPEEDPPMARPFRFGVQLQSLPAGDFAGPLRRIEELKAEQVPPELQVFVLLELALVERL